MEQAPSNAYSSETATDDDATPDYSIAEMGPLLDSQTRELARAKGIIDKAQQDFDTFVTNHPLAQGEQGEGIRAELTKQHLPTLEAAEVEAARIADTVHANVASIYHQASRPQFDLSEEERQAIAIRGTDIREECDVLAYPRLVDAVRYAVLKDNRVSMACYAKYVPLRLAAGEHGTAGEWRDSAANREKAELRRLLTTISRKLADQTLTPIHAKAGDLLTEAGALQRLTTKRRQSSQRFAFQGDNDVPWNQG